MYVANIQCVYKYRSTNTWIAASASSGLFGPITQSPKKSPIKYTGPSGKGLKGTLAFEDKGKTLYYLILTYHTKTFSNISSCI